MPMALNEALRFPLLNGTPLGEAAIKDWDENIQILKRTMKPLETPEASAADGTEVLGELYEYLVDLESAFAAVTGREMVPYK